MGKRSMVRVALAVYLDVDPACLIDPSDGDVQSVTAPGDLAFIGGAVAREWFGFLTFVGKHGGLVGGARVSPGLGSVMSVTAFSESVPDERPAGVSAASWVAPSKGVQ